jgi:hypothetical protein
VIKHILFASLRSAIAAIAASKNLGNARLSRMDSDGFGWIG